MTSPDTLSPSAAAPSPVERLLQVRQIYAEPAALESARGREVLARFPGCRTRARCCDLDHQQPHPHGDTAHDNLACLCEHHHRLSHQAPGWRLHRADDGGLVWTLPSGRTITTYPPPLGTDDAVLTTTAPAPRTSRERYTDALDRIRNARPAPPRPDIPF